MSEGIQCLIFTGCNSSFKFKNSQDEPMTLGIVRPSSQTRLTNNNWPTIRVKLSGQNKQQIVGPLRRMAFLSVRLRIKAWLWPTSQASHPYFTPIGSHRLSCPGSLQKNDQWARIILAPPSHTFLCLLVS